MKNINDNCNRCGKCCEAIWMSVSIDEVKNSKSLDVPFILKNWTPITEEEAEKINPYVVNIYKNKSKAWRNYYKCLMYDKENKLCKDHKNRPDVCGGFPFYPHQTSYFIEINGVKKLDKNYSLYSENCYFQKHKATEKETSKYFDSIRAETNKISV
jgi:Fe-S-cluster containining protein